MKYITFFERFFIIAMITAIIMGFASNSFAAENAFAINIQSALTSIVQTIAFALVAVVAWVVNKASKAFQQKTGMEIEDSMRQYINDAVTNGIYYARDQILDNTKNISNPEVKSEVIATASNYILNAVPDALKYFDIDNRDGISKLITARLPQIERS